MTTWSLTFEALRNRPSSMSVPPTKLPRAWTVWTREALQSVGIEPTNRDLETAFWSDRIVDLCDEVEYFLKRHEARTARKTAKRKGRK